MTPTEEQLTAIANYKDIIDQHLPEIADGIAVTPQTLKGSIEDERRADQRTSTEDLGLL